MKINTFTASGSHIRAAEEFLFISCRLFSSLQKQHESFRDWLQTKEKQSVEASKARLLLKDLQDER